MPADPSPRPRLHLVNLPEVLAFGFAPRGPGGSADGGALADLPADLRAPAPGVRPTRLTAPRSWCSGFTARGPGEAGDGGGGDPAGWRPRGPRPSPTRNLPEVLAPGFAPRGPGGAADGGAAQRVARDPPPAPPRPQAPGPQPPPRSTPPRSQCSGSPRGVRVELLTVEPSRSLRRRSLRAPGPGFTPGSRVEGAGDGGAAQRVGDHAGAPEAAQAPGSTCGQPPRGPRPQPHPVNLPEVLAPGFAPRGPGGSADGGAPRTCRRIFEPQAPASPQGVRLHLAEVPEPLGSGFTCMRPRGPGAWVRPEGSGWSC